MPKIAVNCWQCPGDTLSLSATIYSIAKLYPDQFKFRFHGICPDLYNNYPWLYTGHGYDSQWKPEYGHTICRSCNANDPQTPVNFLECYAHDWNTKYPSFPVTLVTSTPHIYLTDSEQICKYNKPYIVMSTSHKKDYEVKQWSWDKWQEVADYVQSLGYWVYHVGEINKSWHCHKPLEGKRVVNLIGKTGGNKNSNTGTIRDYIALCYHASFGLSHESLLNHILSSTFHTNGSQKIGIPCVVIKSGWNSNWVQYPTSRVIHRHGVLNCCRLGGCWKAKLKDCPNNHRCMTSISVQDVVREVELVHQSLS